MADCGQVGSGSRDYTHAHARTHARTHTSSRGNRSLSSSLRLFHLAIRGGIRMLMYSCDQAQIRVRHDTLNQLITYNTPLMQHNITPMLILCVSEGGKNREVVVRAKR